MTFKEMLARGKTLKLIGVTSPIEALFLESMDFEAAYLSGAALSTELGILDEGHLSREDVARRLRKIRKVSDLPLVVDCDTGLYAPKEKIRNNYDEYDAIAKTVRTLEQAGASAIQIEDQVPAKKRCGHLPGKELVSVNDMFWKIRIARLARKNMLIIARTDARTPEGLEAAIWRAERYVKAGADAIFPEALESFEEFAEFRAQVPNVSLVANLTTHGKTPETISADDLFKIGYQMILFPVPLRILLKKFQEITQEIKRYGSMRGFVVKSDTLSRDELNDFIRKYSKPYRK